MTIAIEQVRQAVRDVIGYDNLLYRFASKSSNYIAVSLKEGPMLAGQLRRLHQQAAGDPQAISLRNLKYPIWLRPGTHDVPTIIDTVIREEYGHFNLDAPLRIVDAGAYIGDVSAYFLSQYPGVHCIALEPNKENYEIAKKNLSPYGSRIRLLKKGLYSQETNLTFTGTGTGGGIGDADAADCQTIQTTTVSQILKEIPEGHIDLLKIDIEGAELEVFQSDLRDWLPKVKRIIVETHGPDITAFVHEVLRNHGWSFQLYRSVWYCRNGK